MTPSPLRCRSCPDGESHFDHGLRDQIAAAIRRWPDTDAPQWIGPESVLSHVEDFLGWRDDDA